MPLYHFSCGNTARGTIGFCANIRAANKAQAVERLASLLPEELEISDYKLRGDTESGEYVWVYFNAEALSIKQIDDVNDED